MSRGVLLFVGMLFLLSTSAFADSIAVTTELPTGSRTTPATSGVTVPASGDWSGDFKISWNIVDQGTYWDYSYTFSTIADTPLKGTPSHFIIELSDIITPKGLSGYIYDVVGGSADPNNLKLWEPGESGNPNWPAGKSFYGLKLDFQANTFAFSSTQNPMWGDFYTKDGENHEAYNTGLGTDPTEATTDFTNWIPVPDTERDQPPVIPEPATMVLGLLGLGFVGARIGHRRRVGRRDA